MRDLDLSVRVLVDGERVDDAHRAARLQTLQLGDDLTVKLRVLEAEHNELNRPYCHVCVSSIAWWTDRPWHVAPGHASRRWGECRRSAYAAVIQPPPGDGRVHLVPSGATRPDQVAGDDLTHRAGARRLGRRTPAQFRAGPVSSRAVARRGRRGRRSPGCRA